MELVHVNVGILSCIKPYFCSPHNKQNTNHKRVYKENWREALEDWRWVLVCAWESEISFSSLFHQEVTNKSSHLSSCLAWLRKKKLLKPILAEWVWSGFCGFPLILRGFSSFHINWCVDSLLFDLFILFFSSSCCFIFWDCVSLIFVEFPWKIYIEGRFPYLPNR